MRAFYKSVNANTIPVNATNVSSAEFQIAGKGGVVRIANDSTVAVAVKVGVTGMGAAVFPTQAAPNDAYVVLAGVTELFQIPPDAYVRVITASGTTVVYFARGEGI